MDTRARALVVVFATILAVGPLAARDTAAMIEGSGGDGLGGGGRTSITSAGSATGGASVVTWGARQKIAAKTWSYGGHLATTTSATETFLHDVGTTDRVDGIPVDNNGPYLGVNYVRGDAGGTTWGTPFRVNSASQHGDGAVIATSDAYVYVSWFKRTRYQGYDPAAPRRLLFRRNTGHGDTASWDASLALTATGTRVGLLTMAASGSFVYVVYTDADHGDIRLSISNDHGVTWATSTIGTTTETRGTSGFEGGPSIAAAGSNVVVSWIADDEGSVVARVSTTGGSSWDSPSTLGVSSTYVTASAARDTRIGVLWMAEDGARFSLSAGGTWGDVRTVGPPSGNGRTYKLHYQPALAFGDAGQVGVAWGACWQHCASFDGLTSFDLVWAESKDDGVAWYDTQVLGNGGGSKWRAHDSPAVLWPAAATRIVAWNGYRLAYPYRRMFLKIGSGTN